MSLCLLNLFFNSLKHAAHKQSSYISFINSNSFALNFTSKHWHCVILPGLHSNCLLHRGQYITSYCGKITSYNT